MLDGRQPTLQEQALGAITQHAQATRVVTARENYTLEKLENSGVRGPAKYEAAGITWAGEPPAFASE